MWVRVVVVFAILLLMVVVVQRCRSPERYQSSMNQMSKVPLETMLKRADTLDLIAIWIPGEFGASVVNFFIQSRWIHLAFVYRHRSSNSAYVIEVSGQPSNENFNPGETNYLHHIVRSLVSRCGLNWNPPKTINQPPSSVNVVPLDDYVNKQLRRGCRVAWVPCRIDVQHKMDDDVMDWIQGCSLTTNPFDFLQAIQKTEYKEAAVVGSRSVLCTELIVDILQRLCIFRKRYKAANYHTGELIFNALWNPEHCAFPEAFAPPLFVVLTTEKEKDDFCEVSRYSVKTELESSSVKQQ